MSESIAIKAGWSDYIELTKPRLSMLSVMTALVGYVVARPPWDIWKLPLLVVGTSLAAGGVAALNQWLEYDTDALMKRTAGRPIPAGKVTRSAAFMLGAAMCATAVVLLYGLVHPLSALLTVVTIFWYLCCYTPAKRWSRWSTEIGAAAGAFPPLIGWAAGEGRATPLGWVLFGMLFFWQMPHFMAVAWTYRKDYSAAGFPILAVRDASGGRVACWAFANTVALVIVSLLPGLWHSTGWFYQLTAAIAGGWLLWRTIDFLQPATRDAAARKLFFATITYLPLVLGALVADRLLISS